MSIFFLKSILSVILIFSCVLAMYSMFEIFGRSEHRDNARRLINLHKYNGIFYFIVFSVTAYFCLNFIFLSKTELSSRSAFHGLFAILILVLMGIKTVFIRAYRQFYEQVKIIGLSMAILTFAMVGMSAGYYLLVSGFGTDPSYDEVLQYKKRAVYEGGWKKSGKSMLLARKDLESIGRGKNLFDSKCKFCHDAHSTETIVGPGLMGILKRPELPVSKRPARPENVVIQLKHPINRMPSFDYLSDEEIADIIAFLNTL